MRVRVTIAATSGVLAALLGLACRPSTTAQAAAGGGATAVSRLSVPPGFHVTSFTSTVPGARSLALGTKGTVFVGTQSGAVYGVVDRDHDGAADEVFTIAKGLDTPNGVAFRQGALYVAEVSRVQRYDAIEDHLAAPLPPVTVIDGLPREHHHGWKFIAFGPDDLLYVPVGAPCNVCESADPRFASILRFRADGTPVDTMARGVRNTVGFDWEPGSGTLWFTDNGRDLLGDDVPPDELNRAPVAGRHYGFPVLPRGDDRRSRLRQGPRLPDVRAAGPRARSARGRDRHALLSRAPCSPRNTAGRSSSPNTAPGTAATRSGTASRSSA